MDTIMNVRQTAPRHYRIDGIKDGQKSLVMLASFSADGEMKGWGQDFVVFDNNGLIRTVDARGKVICSSYRCYYPGNETFGGVGGDQFTVLTKSNAVKVFDRKCKRIK